MRLQLDIAAVAFEGGEKAGREDGARHTDSQLAYRDGSEDRWAREGVLARNRQWTRAVPEADGADGAKG